MEKNAITESVTKRTRGRPRKDQINAIPLDVESEEEAPPAQPVDQPVDQKTPAPKERKPRTQAQLDGDERNRQRMLAMHRDRRVSQTPTKPTLKRSTNVEPESESDESESDESVHIIRKPRESRKIEPRQRKPKKVVYISESEDDDSDSANDMPRSSFYFA